MSWMIRLCELLARWSMAAIFIQAGMNKCMHWDQTLEYMRAAGMLQYAECFLLAAASVEIFGGLSLAFGFYQRLAAAILALFLIPVTCTFHAFWNLQDSPQQQMQAIHFMKNLAIFGGLLFVATKVPAAKEIN